MCKRNDENAEEQQSAMEGISSGLKSNPNPKATAGILSTLTFWYTIPTFIRSIKKKFSEEDIYATLPEFEASRLGTAAIKLWKQEIQHCEKSKQTPSLLKVLVKLFWRRWLFLVTLSAAIELGPRVYLSLSLGEFIDGHVGVNYSTTILIYALFVSFCCLLQTVMAHPYLLMCGSTALKVQVVCSVLIYQKILKLSKTSLRQTTPGQIINLLSNDTNAFERLSVVLNYIIIVPVQASLILYLTFREVGISGLIGISFTILFIPIYYVCGILISKYHVRTSARTDERIRLTNETVQGINIIKMYAWEKPFASLVALARKLEIDSITISGYLKIPSTLHSSFITLSLFISIVSASYFDVTVSAKSAFILTALYNTFGTSFMLFLPQAVGMAAETNVSINRISKFLATTDEIEMKTLSKNSEYAVAIKDGSAKWNRSTNRYIFKNFTCNIQSGSLTAVIGSVGCGKSSFIYVLLQELPLLNGSLTINGTISYASQEPWIFCASVRENILFGSEMNEDRYKSVVKCCALEHDFKLLSYGDNTVVGERGASLSGGQKARINLARSVYRDADIYLLDDPLSAVDTHVGKQIFKECIQTFLRNKTVILVTHQLQYLKYADHIVVIENSHVAIEGSPEDLQTTGFDFAKYLQKNEECGTETIASVKISENALKTPPPKKQGEVQNSATKPLEIYKNYILASKSYGWIFLTLCSFILAQLFTTLSFYFVAYWVKMERLNQLESYAEQRKLSAFVYSGITAVAIILAILRTVFYVKLSMKSSTVLHNCMFDKIVHAPLKFFYVNSSGRILNRFAKDLGTIDQALPHAAVSALRTLFTALGSLLLICVMNPWFIIPTTVLSVIIYFMRKLYLLTNINIIRVENAARSPIYGHANSTLQGLESIRAFGDEKALTKQFYTFQDTHSSTKYLTLTVNRAFAYLTDLTCFIYITVLTVYFVLSTGSAGENIGLVITQAIQIMGILPFGLRQLTDLESNMVSVERVMEYSSIEQEHNLCVNSASESLNDWPKLGEIQFRGVFLKYSETDPFVLKSLNFIIKSGEKIGIVGRTGAGKSSIINILFQLTAYEGTITIDGIDIGKVNLHEVRKKMSIIPQDPVLFSGTIRKNLDPFDEFTDEVLWKSLQEVRLKHVVDGMGSGLNSEILQNGSNLSVGQRQLICLARAIIRDNKILILDEATANIDIGTDAIIQESIRKNFAHCTVLTVAHRLSTVMDSDKILVMDAGEIAEFGHPQDLLQNKEGAFYNMVRRNEDVKTFLNN